MIKTLDPDNVATLFQFNAKGELEWVTNGVNRVSQTVNDYVTYPDNDVRQQTRHYAYAQGLQLLLTTKQTAVTGLQSWYTVQQDQFTPVLYINDIVYTNNGVRLENFTRPDGMKVKRYHSYDRLLSEITLDYSGNTNQTVTYGYDEFGRLETVNDTSTGTTTVTYNNADQVTSVTTPPPGDGQPAQTTQTQYDLLGRPLRVIEPDGQERVHEYYPNGLLKREYG